MNRSKSTLNMYTTPEGFDLKSLGLFLITFILSTGPQGTTWISSVASFLTATAALSTVAYNLLKVCMELKDRTKNRKP